MEEATDDSANWNAGCKDQCDKRCNRVEEEVINSRWGTGKISWAYAFMLHLEG